MTTVSTGYAHGQLLRAFATRTTHEDPATRARADAKLAAWAAVVDGMVSGTLAIGSRTPTAAPAWVTLEVLRGGFASGAYAAGGELLPHERARLERLGRPADAAARAVLNASYLDEAGLAELGALLDSGCYRVELPEESALLVVAWLLRAGQRERAIEVMEALTPWLDRLRFYPQPAERPLESSAQVCRQPLRETVAGLTGCKTPAALEVMNEALAIWAPLSDRAVALVLETVEGEAPSCASTTAPVEGGWPFRTVTPAWVVRARALLAEYAALRVRYPRGKKLDRPGESFCELRRVIALAAEGGAEAVSAADAGRVRSILGHIAHKRGLPGSPLLGVLRGTQAAQARQPLHAELRAAVVARLRRFPQDGGLASLDGVLGPVTAEELDAVRMAAGSARGAAAPRLGEPVHDVALPPGVEAQLARSLEAPIDVLIERGVLPSPETLAEVTPQLSAFVKAAALRDLALRRLYGATYVAFRGRRSLLLLDLASQVRLEELPWVAAVEAQRGEGLSAEEQARETLRTLVVLTLDAFPHVIFPNPLVTEIGALAKTAGLTLPLVEEIAADIFMGTFVDKFRRAALVAAHLLEGTIYERYYDARFAEVRALPAPPPEERKGPQWFWQKKPEPTGPDFGALCAARVGSDRGRSVAGNGKVIEQEQILTTHNLAVLFEALVLGPALRPRLPDLARACFTWIAGRAPQAARAHRHAQLQAHKNMAYAWRQMTFFLALAGPDAQLPFVAWAVLELEEAPPEVRSLLGPHLRGLTAAAIGVRVEDAPGAQRFLGWV